MNIRNWVIRKPEQKLAEKISRELGISLSCAKILLNRGVDSIEEARIFLYPEIEKLNNPFLLSDMEKGVLRIRKALDTGEKILVYGDSDVDGITSICIIYRTIKALGGDVFWYTPEDESYGLNKEVIEKYSKENIKLMVTVDCGITAFEEIDFAKLQGIDTIVCDHHEVQSQGLPGAYGVIDPKRADFSLSFQRACRLRGFF